MSRKKSNFTDNYQKLYEIASTLRNKQDNIDIDQLIPMVEEATKAYNACKSRLERVQQALQQHFHEESDEE